MNTLGSSSGAKAARVKNSQYPAGLEPRWPVALAIVLALLVLTLMTNRISVVPRWVSYIIGLAQILPLAAVSFSRGKPLCLRVERISILAFSSAAECLTVASAFSLIWEMLNQPARNTGRQLISSCSAGWIINVLEFAFVYWLLDRGGPEARKNAFRIRPDLLFPQTGVPDDAPPNWTPTFVDYLFLSFTTATAFSPTDTLPLTSRAKLLMLFESAFSLIMIVTVAARAINILAG